MRKVLVPVCLTVAALVAGCAAVGTQGTSGGVARADRVIADQGSTSSASPKPGSGSLKRVDTIELDAESLSFLHGDALQRVGSLRSGSGTVSTLTKLLGTPQRTTTEVGDGGHCLPASTSYTWGGAIRVVDLVKRASTGNELDVRILKQTVRARSGAIIALQGPDGVQVGQDVADLLGRMPDSDKAALGTSTAPAWQVVLQEGWSVTSNSTATGTNGVSALTDGTTVSVIGSPMPVHAKQDC